MDLTQQPKSNIQQRAAPYNYYNANNISVLIFTPKYLQRYTNKCNYNKSILITNINQTITDSFYKTNSTSFIFILLRNNNSNFSIEYHNTTSLISTIVTPIQNNSKFIRTVQNLGYIYLLFDTGIYVFI